MGIGERVKIGEEVLTIDGKRAIIKAVKPIHCKNPQTICNFEVADVHTSYVGYGILVHNMNGGDCGGKYITNEEAEAQANKLEDKKAKKVTLQGEAVLKIIRLNSH